MDRIVLLSSLSPFSLFLNRPKSRATYCYDPDLLSNFFFSQNRDYTLPLYGLSLSKLITFPMFSASMDLLECSREMYLYRNWDYCVLPFYFFCAIKVSRKQSS